MANVKVKQDLIPKFILKSFGKNIIIADLNNKKIIRTTSLKTTVINFYYEDERFLNNFIEDKLSIIESKFYKIWKRIITSYSDDIDFSAKEMETIITFINVQ